jgi:hypothetical protein
MTKIKIEIGEFVLEGFDYHDHGRISAAVQRELALLMTEKGLPDGGAPRQKPSNVSSLTFAIRPGLNPGEIGAEVARSVYKGLGRHSAMGRGLRELKKHQASPTQ